MRISNLKISVRLAVGFAFILLLLVAVAVVSVVRLNRVNAEVDLTLHDRYPKIRYVTEVQDKMNQIARSMRNTLIMTEAESIRAEVQTVYDSRKAIMRIIEILDREIQSDRGKELLASVKAARLKFVESQDTFLKLVNENKRDEAAALLLSELRPRQITYMSTLATLAEFQESLMEESGKAVSNTVKHTTMLVTALATVAAMLGAIIALLITRSIVGPVERAVRIAQTVAAGDLTSKIEVSRTDEIGHLMQALKEMNESLVKIVGNVRAGTDTIATASSQIAAGTLDLSSRTEEQASALEETASSMEELTSTVKQNADNARQANMLAATASAVAQKGGTVVAQVVETMGSINESSRRIVDIINVIDGIAFQTNILALNAAVEAARAGEQGRGFAVVATEVRSLAQRSAAAAKEIKSLIDDSVGKVETGTRLVADAGSTMGDVVESVRRVSDIIGEIAAASQEQSAGIEQINQAISQMDQVTQQNAALVEETAAAADAMQGQSRALSTTVSAFKTDGSAARPVAVQATPLNAQPRPAPARVTQTPRPQPFKPKALAVVGQNSEWEEF